MVSTNYMHAANENWSNSVWRSWAVWDTTAALSAKTRSRMVIFFCFAFRRTGFNRRTSDNLCRLTHVVDEQKAHFDNIKRKKRVGASTRACLTLFFIVNNSETLSSWWKVDFLLAWKRIRRVEETWSEANLQWYRK